MSQHYTHDLQLPAHAWVALRCHSIDPTLQTNASFGYSILCAESYAEKTWGIVVTTTPTGQLRVTMRGQTFAIPQMPKVGQCPWPDMAPALVAHAWLWRCKPKSQLWYTWLQQERYKITRDKHRNGRAFGFGNHRKSLTDNPRICRVCNRPLDQPQPTTTNTTSPGNQPEL